MKNKHLNEQDPIKVVSWYLMIVLHIILGSAVVLLFKVALRAIMY